MVFCDDTDFCELQNSIGFLKEMKLFFLCDAKIIKGYTEIVLNKKLMLAFTICWYKWLTDLLYLYLQLNDPDGVPLDIVFVAI